MNRFADPSRCPDCRAQLVPAAESCGMCQLLLRGPVAQELFTTLLRADQLLGTLRLSGGVAPTSPAGVPAGAPRLGKVGAPTSSPARIRVTSVPKILLTLGAGCLLVAALVFLAVTWSVMGVGGRTATLLGFTTITGLTTAWVSARALRGATEALGLVTLGLLALDISGAQSAGWFGDIEAATFVALLGALLTAAATAAAVWLRRTPAQGFTAGQVTAAMAAATFGGGLVAGDWVSTSTRMLVAVLLLIALTVTHLRLTLRVAAVGTAVVTMVAWTALSADGFVRVVDDPSGASVWGRLEAWPLLAAAAVAAGLAAMPKLPLLARQAAASVAVLQVVICATAPAFDESATVVALVSAGTLVLASAGVWLLARPWGTAALLTLAVAGAVEIASVLGLGAEALERIGDAVSPIWRGNVAQRLPTLAGSANLQGWVLPVAAAALCLGVVSVLRLLGRSPVAASHVSLLGVLTLLTTAELYPVPLASIVVVALVAGVTYVARREAFPAAVCLAAGLVASLYADEMTASALVVCLACSWWVHVADDRFELSAGAGVTAQLALAALAWTVGSVLGLTPTWVAAAGIVGVCAVALASGHLPGHRNARERAGLEVGATLGWLGLFAGGLDDAAGGATATWLAVYLTLFGVALCLQSLLRDDRRDLAWAGGVLLALASWVRLADLGVDQPEAYTLPSALVLVGVGLLHLRRHPHTSTFGSLSAGLGLALVPSLLWVMVEPATTRSVLLGAACLGLVLAGLRLRWSAPLAYGAVVGALLVLRHAAPYLGASVERWMLIGAAGAFLLALGITWEQRVREARAMLGYVRALR